MICKQKAKIKQRRVRLVRFDCGVVDRDSRVVPHGLDVVGFGLNTIDLSAVVGQYLEPDSGQWLTDVAKRSSSPW